MQEKSHLSGNTTRSLVFRFFSRLKFTIWFRNIFCSNDQAYLYVMQIEKKSVKFLKCIPFRMASPIKNQFIVQKSINHADAE